jgi:hypothetical protein
VAAAAPLEQLGIALHERDDAGANRTKAGDGKSDGGLHGAAVLAVLVASIRRRGHGPPRWMFG